MDITAAEWNQRFPVGTPVQYHPIIGEPEFITSKTRSGGWIYHSEPAVKREGKRGA